MTTDTQDLAPGVAVEPADTTQNTSADALETEVAQPDEAGQEPAKELSPEAKEAKALKRRVDRLTRERYEERARFDVERQQWQRQPAQEQQTAPNTLQATEQAIEQRAKELARQLAEENSFTDRCNSLVAEGQKHLGEKFTRAIDAVKEERLLFTNDNKPTPLLTAVLDSDESWRLLNRIGSDPDLLAEIADLSPVRQAKRIGQLEAELAPKRREPSQAPRPLQTVRPQQASGVPDPDKDTAAWIAWRNKTASRR